MRTTEGKMLDMPSLYTLREECRALLAMPQTTQEEGVLKQPWRRSLIQ